MDIQSWTPFYDQDQTNEDTFFHVPGISGLLSPERILTTNGDRAAEDSGPDHVCLEEVYFFLYRARTCSTPSQHPSSINPTIENQKLIRYDGLSNQLVWSGVPAVVSFLWDPTEFIAANPVLMGKPAKAREPHAHHRCRWNDLERDLLVVESFTMNALLGDPSHTENVVDRRDHFRINSLAREPHGKALISVSKGMFAEDNRIVPGVFLPGTIEKIQMGIVDARLPPRKEHRDHTTMSEPSGWEIRRTGRPGHM
ncbi:hypothetical protein POX_a00693 [Penicillium oxalicum]|uniref:Uncharacterized protein n=1 Tax=Penicillium oxalicum (strain 114-2 / CGMCC 5302) TaxID=933388 RepID=S7ZVC2_PENO1|nr:hypothetical protein POX_a00693 [Penicillium oxalicum]EPS34334.1 hypothetical protein PDE_09298 [Penicillium oxalicum 114-2]KAI2794103.1 hypothetical protein POX_a00693 [Penicillium oxalicum]